MTVPEAEEPEILPENIPLDILYEDADVILMNKPKDMVVHPAAGHYSGTLVNGLLMYHCRDESFRHQRRAAPGNRTQNRQGYHRRADCLQK